MRHTVVRNGRTGTHAFLPRDATPVAIVGAGPSGLVAATVLGKQGVEVLVLDRRESVSRLPRAVGISLRQMELLRACGLEAAVRGGSDDVELAALDTVTAAGAGNGVPRAINVPSLAQSRLLSPTSPARVPQDHLEHVLLEALADLPSVTVRRGVEVRDLTQTERGVRLEAIATADGTQIPVRAAYVLGADGARSVVRRAAGISMDGPSDAMAGLAVEFRAPMWDVVGEHRYALYSVSDPEGAGVLIPAGDGDRWQYGIVAQPGESVSRYDDPSVLRARVRAASGVSDLPVEIVRTFPFTAAAQIAERFSLGRVFLVGDAAHRVTPRGGNGLAMAVRDGFDLGWRLAWVLRGWAPESFLTGYEAEGRALAAERVARAAANVGVGPLWSEVQQDLGGRISHAWVDEQTSTLDLIGPGLTLMTAGSSGTDPVGWFDAAAAAGAPGALPVDVVTLPVSAAHAIGLRGPGGAILVRPDGVPVASWWRSEDPRSDLARAVRDVTGSATRLGEGALR